MPSFLDNDSQTSTKKKEVDLPITSQSVSPAGYISAIILNIATSIFLVVVCEYDILFPIGDEEGVQTITNGTRTGYAACITLLATLLSTFSVGQIKLLLLQRNAHAGSQGISTTLREYNATLAGLSSFSEKLRVWQISLCLMITGLGTTALVTGLTPSTIIHISPAIGRFGILWEDGEAHVGEEDWPGSGRCLRQDNDKLARADWSWRTANGSFLNLVADLAAYHCPPERVLRALSESRSVLRMNLLTIAEVAVDKSAIGLPYHQEEESGYVDGRFGATFGTKGLEYRSAGFRWASQCLPALTRNPVRCRQSLTYERNGNGTEVTFRADSDGCFLTLPITKYSNGTSEGRPAGKACPGLYTPGKLTLLFGAVGNDSLYNDSAQDLYQFVNINNNPLEKDSSSKSDATKYFNSHFSDAYGVVCDVNVEPSIGFRTINLSIVGTKRGHRDAASRLSISSPSQAACVPTLENGGHVQDLQSFLRTDDALATGAGATMSLLTGPETNLTTLMQSMDWQWGSLNRTFFSDSTNAFEDMLGVSSAIAMGMYWGSANPGQSFNLSNGRLARTRARIGSKDAKAVLCVLPSIFTAGILVFLAIDEHRRSRVDEKEAASR